MTLLRRLAAALVALIAPPLAVYIVMGPAINFYFSVTLFAIALGVFFLLAALPGLGVWTLAILHATAVSLFGRIRRAE
jgi:hypothetical protein